MSPFGALLARPHAKALACACALGWLTFASLGLSVVLLVEERTGSFAAAGAAVGAFSCGAGLLAPVRGRLVDRHGPSALRLFAVAHCAGLLILLGGCVRGAPLAALIAAAAGAGAVAPPLIASARALWPRVAGPRLTRTSHAANALLGDLGTVLGPVAAGGLAVLLGPALALALMCLGPLIGAFVVAALGAALGADAPEPDASAHDDRRGDVVRGNAGMHTVVACGVVLGVLLGAVEVLAPALAGHAGSPALGAVPLAAFAGGSVVSSLWSGRGGRVGTPQRRYVAGFVLFALVLATCAVVRSVTALSLVLAAAGIGYGLHNVGLLELLDDLVPERNAVEALTWLTSAQGLGVAVGATAAGALAATSPDAALTLVAVVAPLGALLVLRRRATLGMRASRG